MVLLNDLLPDGILFNRDYVEPEKVWQYYKQFPEFQGVVFDPFEARLQGHRKQAQENYFWAQQEKLCLDNDPRLHPRQAQNINGKPVFDLHPDKLLLCGDVKNKLHLMMTPTELQNLRSPYQNFDKKRFKHRIYQEVRHQKYIHYLELKRENSGAKRYKSMPTDSVK